VSANITGIFAYLKRGLGYWVTALLATSSGYLMIDGFPKLLTLLLLIPVSIAFVFSVSYAIRFDYNHAVRGPAYDYDQRFQSEAKIVSIGIAIAVGLISLLAYMLLHGIVPGFKFWIYIILISGMYLGYARFFLSTSNMDPNSQAAIRHQLIWPVVLSIAISIYTGRFFSKLDNSWAPLIAICTLALYFLATERFKVKKKVFLISNLFFAAVVLAFTTFDRLGVLTLPQFLSGFPALLFAFTMAAYLAAFEAWRITSYIASQQSNIAQYATVPLSVTTDSIPHPSKTISYFNATLASFVITIWLMPIAYVFSDNGLLFLIGFTVHAIWAFLYWASRGKDLANLTDLNWVIRKLWFGFFFLFLMVIDTKLNWQPSYQLRDRLFQVTIPMLITSAAVLGTKLVRDIRQLGQSVGESFPRRLFSHRMNTVRLLALLSFATSIVIVLSYEYAPTNLKFKMEYAYLAYTSFVALAIILEIGDFTNMFKLFTAVLTALLGVLQTVRLPTSLLIGLFVFMPSKYHKLGNEAAFWSMLPFCLISMVGFSLNDFFDANRDKINKPHRAIPSGRLTRNEVLTISIGTSILALISIIAKLRDRRAVALCIAALIGVAVYNFFVKFMGCSKTVYTAFLCAIPIFYDVIFLNYQKAFLLLPMAAILFITGREILMDVKDKTGDKASGIVTLPMKLGDLLSVKLAFGFQFVGLALLLPLVRMINPVVGASVWCLMFASLIIASCLWSYNYGKYQRGIVFGLWLPMLAAMMILIAQ